ncbi:hypothetical protein AAFF_G00346610 [Aldrovandia affinis]|uniref:Uncharacterized protein n=1 Tax=Aldrovandia affinis TaxID=143900 RepID=A0AAD7SJR3_9TELE|nr:hypothetical protein AAFF_G00346610 [Aldrovandia affinis]
MSKVTASRHPLNWPPRRAWRRCHSEKRSALYTPLRAGDVLIGALLGSGLLVVKKTVVSGLYLRLEMEDESLRRKRLMTPLLETKKGRAHGLLITESP